MPRTLAVSDRAPGRPSDFVGAVVDGLESLRQRILQRLLFWEGTWFLDIRQGIDYDLILGQPDVRLAAVVITEAIRDEGGDEVIEVTQVRAELERGTRVLLYSCVVKTIYGPLELDLPLAA